MYTEEEWGRLREHTREQSNEQNGSGPVAGCSLRIDSAAFCSVRCSRRRRSAHSTARPAPSPAAAAHSSSSTRQLVAARASIHSALACQPATSTASSLRLAMFHCVEHACPPHSSFVAIRRPN